MSTRNTSIQKREYAGINSIRDLTKDELIFCIEKTFESDYTAKHWFERYVNQIAHERSMRQLEEDKAKGDRWIALEHEYADLLEPYRGKKIGELPPDVIEKGAKLEREIRKAWDGYSATFDTIK